MTTPSRPLSAFERLRREAERRQAQAVANPVNQESQDSQVNTVNRESRVNLDSQASQANRVNQANQDSSVNQESQVSQVNRDNRASPVNQASQTVSQPPSVVNQGGSWLAAVNTASPDNLVNHKPLANQDSHVNHSLSGAGKWDRPGRRMLAARIPLKLYDQFDFWCSQRRLEKQSVLEQAIIAIVEGRLTITALASPVNLVNPASWLTSLMIDDADAVDILSHYARCTGNDPKQTDLEALAELRALPVVAVKCGILMSVMRAKGRINSLRYCVGAAHEAAEVQTDLNTYLAYLEHKASKSGRGKTRSADTLAP